jgi:hypothetical protein
LLLHSQIGHSSVYILTADLSKGNFTKHPAFPIFLAKLVDSTMEGPVPVELQLGEEIPLPPSSKYSSLLLNYPQGQSTEFINDWQNTWDTTGVYGEYRLDLQDKDGIETKLFLGVNAGDIRESDISPQDWIQNYTENGVQTEHVTLPILLLTPWLLAFTVVLFLLEAVVAWR